MVIKFKLSKSNIEGQTPPSTSLMIKGAIIRETDETEVNNYLNILISYWKPLKNMHK